MFRVLQINIALIFDSAFYLFHTSPRFADCKGRTFILILQKKFEIFSPAFFSDLLFLSERATKVEIVGKLHKPSS